MKKIEIIKINVEIHKRDIMTIPILIFFNPKNTGVQSVFNEI